MRTHRGMGRYALSMPHTGQDSDATHDVPHMSGEAFCAAGQELLARIEAYWRTVESRPVRSTLGPGDVLKQLPAHAPTHGEQDWAAVLADVERIILPGLTHWQHPAFFAYFPANISGPSVLGELLSAGLGVQGMLWSTSPACTELEMRMMDWLGEAIGLPSAFLFAGGGGGVIQGTASEAAIAAMLAARGRALRGVPAGERRGRMEKLTLYASTQAHSSIMKGAMVAGLALAPDDFEQVRLIETDSEHRMDPAKLAERVREDVRAGRTPFFACASVGTTGTTAVDSVREIAAALDGIAGERPWLHVDAAHAGAACICPEFRWMIDGIDRADSICFNPHKWLLTNFDCDCFWTRHPAELTASMSITPEYLRNTQTDAGTVVDYRDWHIPLGRRPRALKLWFVMRHYGIEGLRAHVRGHVRLAELFESLVASSARFELCTTRRLNLVCFRPRPLPGERPEATDARAKSVMDRANATGRVFLTHTALPATERVRGGIALRMAIGGVKTEERHVREAYTLLESLAE